MNLTNAHFTVHGDGVGPMPAAVLATVTKEGYTPTIVADAAPAAAGKTTSPSSSAPVGPLPPTIAAAVARAKAEGKLVVVDFYASWCPPCQRMLKETWPNPILAATMAHIVFVKVDTDAQPAIPKAFHVHGLPDARVLDGQGRQVAALLGFHDAAAAKAALRAALRAASRTTNTSAAVH